MSLGTGILLGIFAFTILIDVPIAFGLGIASLVYIMLFDTSPVMVVAQRMVAGLDSFVLLAIPLFLLAGQLMSTCGLTKSVIGVCEAIVGSTRGGLAIVTILACLLFGALSGSAVADVVAIGTILLPALREAGYDRGFSCAILACAGSVATVIPPSITFIVYGITTGTSIGQLFIGGVIPGIMLGGGLIAVAVWKSHRHDWKGGTSFSVDRLLRALWNGWPAFMVPVLIIGGIRFGFFTPTEAGGMAVAYTLLLGLIYRRLSLRALWGDLRSTAETSGAILILMSTASVFGWILAVEQVPQMVTQFLVGLTSERYVVLLLIVALLLVLGTFMETISIVLILAPVLMPAIRQFGIDPVHFGVVLVVSLAIGANTPPLGIDLMAACRIEGITMMEGVRHAGLCLASMVAVLLVVMFFPQVVFVLQ